MLGRKDYTIAQVNRRTLMPYQQRYTKLTLMGAPSGWALSVPGRWSPTMWWPIHQSNLFRRPKGLKQALKALFFA